MRFIVGYGRARASNSDCSFDRLRRAFGKRLATAACSPRSDSPTNLGAGERTCRNNTVTRLATRALFRDRRARGFRSGASLRLTRQRTRRCRRCHPPAPQRAPLVSRFNAPDTMEVADIAVKPVKEFAKDSYRLIRKCTKPDRKEFSKIATRTGMGFIVMGFVGFFVKLILYVCHARLLTISSVVQPRWFRGSVAFHPANNPASRKIFLPRPLAIEAALWGRGAGFRMSDRHECVMSTLVALRPSQRNDTRARTRRAPCSPSAVCEEWWIDKARILDTPDGTRRRIARVFSVSLFFLPALG